MALRFIIRSLGARTTRVQFAGDGVGHVRELLLLLLEVLGRGRGGVLIEPLGSFLDGIDNLGPC